jgi:hypothetical protein
MPDHSGSVDLSRIETASNQDDVALASLSEEEQEALEKMAALNPEPEGQPVRTAFLVVVAQDGSAVAVSDLDLAVVRDYLPSTDDIYGALQVICKDIEVQEGAQTTASFMHQMAMAQMQQRQHQQMVAGLNLGKS